MNKIVSLTLLAGGSALMITGINVPNSFVSGAARFGSSTDHAAAKLIGGVVAAVMGRVAMLPAGKQA